MERGSWQYQDDVSPSAVDHVWKVVGIAVAAGSGQLIIGALLPHDRPVNLAWFVPGFVIMNVLLVVLAVLVHRTRRAGGQYAPPAPAALAIAMVSLVGVTLQSIGLSGSFGLYREVILVPAIVVLAFGSPLMVRLIAVATIVAVAVAGIAQGLPLSSVPTIVVAYGFGWGGILFIIRMVENEAVKGMRRHRLVAEMAAAVATAGDLDEGLRTMLPLIGDLLRATVIEIRSDRTGAGAVLARWSRTEGAPPCDPAPGDVRAAQEVREAIVHGDHVLLPVAPTGEDGPLVAVVTAPAPGRQDRLTYEHDMDHARVHLDLLADRTHLLRRLEELSRTDSLTGLPNRRTLLDRLDHELRSAQRGGGPLAVVMIDVDDFKAYNDTFGHLAGDEALATVAGLLRDRLRLTDLACRYGGEEFCLVLPGTTTAEAGEILAALHAQCRRLSFARPLTFSGGIAGWVADETPERLLDRADAALYRAKTAGRDQTWVAGDSGNPTRPAPAAASPSAT